MGQVLAVADSLTNFVTSSDDKQSDEMKELMNSLQEIIKTKSELFETRVSLDKATDKTLPISHVLQKFSETYALAKQNMDDLEQGVRDLIGLYSSGKHAESVARTISTSLTLALGSGTAEDKTVQSYCLLVGPLGGFFRVDYFFYVYTVQSQQFRTKFEQLLHVQYIISSVKLQNIDDQTIRAIIQQGYAGEKSEVLRSIYTDITNQLAKDTANKDSIHNDVTHKDKGSDLSKQ